MDAISRSGFLFNSLLFPIFESINFDEMNYNEILDRLGPCGLSCEKCFAFQGGPIEHYSQQLQNALGHFDVYAQRFTTLLNEPVFAKYPEFKEMLAHFAEAGCEGCRKSSCQLFKACQVKDCYKEKNVDFCFQCDEFPCDHTGFDEHLQKRWVKMNERMKQVGVENFYQENLPGSRYK
jgi:hypothetical protein